MIIKHESGYAIDDILGDFSRTPEFRAAYNKDLRRLNSSEVDYYKYFIQKGRGNAGRSECFAQCFAGLAGAKTNC